MKKFLFSSLTVAFTITLTNAQQMSYYPDMVGSPGQSFVLAQDTSPIAADMSFNIGTVGAGQVWNFQGLDADKLDTLNFQSLTVQEMIDFPAANVVMESNIGRIVFDKNSSGLFLHGTALSFQGIPLALNYSPPQQWLPAVGSLGSTATTTSYVDESIYVGIDTTVLGCYINIDSIEIKRRSVYTVTFDGTGELRLPLDTFAYTLRALTSERTIDSIFIYSPLGISGGTCGAFGLSAPIGWSLAPNTLIALSGFAPGSVSNDSTFTASWYYPYTISPIVVAEFTYDSAYADTNFISTRFKGNNTPDIGFEQVEEILLNIFPNPATNSLFLQTNADISKATMLIYNAQGQEVRTVNMNGSNMIDVSGLTNGIYFYQLSEGNKFLHHGKFMIKK